MNISICFSLANLNESNVQVLAEGCGNITIQNTLGTNIKVSFNGEEATIKGSDTLTISDASKVTLYSFVNGIKGNEDTRIIPICKYYRYNVLVYIRLTVWLFHRLYIYVLEKGSMSQDFFLFVSEWSSLNLGYRNG